MVQWNWYHFTCFQWGQVPKHESFDKVVSISTVFFFGHTIFLCQTALFGNDQMTKQYKVSLCYDLLGTHSVGTKVTVQSWFTHSLYIDLWWRCPSPTMRIQCTHADSTEVSRCDVTSTVPVHELYARILHRPCRAVSPRTDKSYVEHFCIHQRWSHPNELVLYRNIARSHHKDLISTNMCVFHTTCVWTMQIGVMSACFVPHIHDFCIWFAITLSKVWIKSWWCEQNYSGVTLKIDGVNKI